MYKDNDKNIIFVLKLGLKSVVLIKAPKESYRFIQVNYFLIKDSMFSRALT